MTGLPIRGDDLDRAGTSISSYFHTYALALRADQIPWPLQSPHDNLNACVLKMTALHQQWSADQLQQMCALSFMLKQLGENIKELERDIREWAPRLLCVSESEAQTGQS